MPQRHDKRPESSLDDLIEHPPVVVGRHTTHVTYDRRPERAGIADRVGSFRAECSCGWSEGLYLNTLEDAEGAITVHLIEARHCIELRALLTDLVDAIREGGPIDPELLDWATDALVGMDWYPFGALDDDDD